MGMKGIPPPSSQGQIGVCCMFMYQVWPCEYSHPRISFPPASANGIFTIWFPSSPCPVRTFNGFPALLLGCLWPHLMLWGSFATPIHFTPKHCLPHISGLCTISASALCPLASYALPPAICLATSSPRLHVNFLFIIISQASSIGPGREDTN